MLEPPESAAGMRTRKSVKILKKTDLAEVLAHFDREHPADEGTNGWARERAEQADKKLRGAWWHAELSGDEALDIQLVGHRHGGIELIPPHGMTVREAAKRFKEIQKDYMAASRECHDRLVRFGHDAFTPVLLSVEPPTGFGVIEYERLRLRNGSLVHLDGLHRLIAWAMAGRFEPERYSGSTPRLQAFIASREGRRSVWAGWLARFHHGKPPART